MDPVQDMFLHLLNVSRMILDRVANGHDEREAAAKMAQRIVDVIGHDVTDEPPHLIESAEDLLRYADAHRIGVLNCRECGRGRCYDEWALHRDELRSLLDAWNAVHA